MRIFAAIERILLDRWSKMKIALKINKWPLLNYREQQLQLKKQYLEDLLGKKWHKFVRSIYDSTRTQVPPLSQNNLNMDGYDTWVAVSDSSRYGSLQFTITARTQTTQHETVNSLWASVGISVVTRESYTIMCVANGMCCTAQISC